MGDKGVMAGANCKRYLQNKITDRKRRRHNSTLLESTDIDEQVACNAPTRLKQTKRQSTQKHLISAINSLAKVNKTDIIAHTTTTSVKKYLRSAKQEYEPEYDTMSFTDTEKYDINASKSSLYLENGNNYAFKNNDMDYRNLEKKQFVEMERKGIKETLNHEECLNAKETEEIDYSKESRTKFHPINENKYQNTSFDCNEGNSSRQSNLSDLNENSNTPSSSYNKTRKECNYDDLEKVVFENHSEISLVKDAKKAKHDHEVIKSTENDVAEKDVQNKCFVFNPTPSHELQMNFSDHQHTNASPSRSHLSSIEQEQQHMFENELSHLSDSLCSENTSPLDHISKISMQNISKNFGSNEESKMPLGEILPTKAEENQKKLIELTNETMKSSLINSKKHLQNTLDIGVPPRSPRDEQYHLYNVEDGNQECAVKSSNDNRKTSSERDNTINFQNACFPEPTLKHDVRPDVLTSIATTDGINYIRGEQSPSTNAHVSINNGNNLEVEPTSLDRSGQSSIKESHENNVTEPIRANLENESEPSHIQESRRFDKYLEKSSPTQQTETDLNVRNPHQKQNEKDIIDEADKVYSEIELQYRQQQHEATISTAYEQMINNHQQQQQQQQQQNNSIEHECEDLRQRHNNAVASLQQMQTLELSMQQQLQSQYSSEQLYQLQQQQERHQQIHIQRHEIQKQEELQQQQHQQHHNLASNQQREHRQHPHLMDFLHPSSQHHHSIVATTHSPLHQQHQQIHEVYHDLMMEEFHEEHNAPYKLGLSPSTVKHENLDDGYETSAGDVLTPNSHASSAHSVTPQHHMQHSGVVTNIGKCEEQHKQHSTRLQQIQHTAHAMNDQNQNLQQDLIPTESTANIANRDPYHFMDDDMNSGTNNNLRNILTPPHSHTRSNQEASALNGFMAMQSEASAPTNLNSSNDIYTLTKSSVHHHHAQKPPCLDTNSNTPIINAEHQHYAEASNEIVGQEQAKSTQKRRGRKKKIPDVGLQPMLERSNANGANLITGFTKTKERKKHDRFNGMSEEEVVKRILPDHLCDNLDIVIIGINPGLFAAYKGHHYAGPGNHFWKCLYLSGLTQEQMNADEDFKLMKYGIGFTNMVQRATKGSADLTRKEIKEGSRILLEKLQRFRPKIAVFNGKLIFEVFSGKKDFNFGRQPECVEGTDTFIWVMPSSSARCAQLPRAADKVPFYAALKKFRDYLNGLIPHIDQSECVFTEERIKQQCEQENYKNQQNNATAGANDSTYQAVGISNANNSLQNPVGYSFDSESNPHGAREGPGPPPQPPAADNNVSNNFMMSSLVGNNHEKKKRGRPKKIKGEEIIDPVTGNKIQVNRQMMGVNNGEYANILNLSVVQMPNAEMPKKKRGRPKKVKPHPNMLQHDIAQSASMLNQKPNIMSIQSLTSEITQGSPHHMQGMQTNHPHVAMYSTPPPRQRSIYSPMASPMASPSLSCSYTTNTPPTQSHHDKLGLPSNGGRESSKVISSELVPPAHHQQNSIQDQNFGESPPPSSPNICTVDFDPPRGSTAASSIVSENVNSELNTLHQRLHGTHQRSRFNSPISVEATPDHNANEHFQQWLSPQPNHNIHSPSAATMFVNSPQQPSLNYHDQQQQQMQSIQQQQQQSQHQDIHPQWPLRHQGRYDDLPNSPYLLSSQVHQTHSHNQASHSHQNQHGSGDVARKSLCGLESLVDQIPTISESESIALSTAAAVNAQVAAAAAVENRLQGMQNSTLGDSQVGNDAHFPSMPSSQNLLTAGNSPSSAPTNNQIQQPNTTSSLLNSNFSVSNLAASSATSNNNNNNSHESYGLAPNARPITNPNAYHHSNLMAAAVLAAAVVNTPTNLSTSSAAAAGPNNHHASMYMDPHTHLTTHVPVNSIYPSVAPPPHHHHHSGVAAHHHHHPTVHYGSAQHTTADYATSNNPYATTQSNVTTSHTLHMPSPNYPYGYPASSTQSNYSAYPHSHHGNHHHGHPHAHHTAHHLAMFDRLKPSDINGYSTGF